jgi:hypothetical protein
VQTICTILLAILLAGCQIQTPSPAPTVPPTTNQAPTTTPQTTSSLEEQDGLPGLPPPSVDEKACFSLRDRHLEICTAYVVNASLAARLPYYKYGRSPIPSRAKVALDRLQSRYSGRAVNSVQSQASAWPADETDVSIPSIRVNKVSVSSDENLATLQTQERWEVKTPDGTVLFRETGANHEITMERLPGLVLHKWVVTGIR